MYVGRQVAKVGNCGGNRTPRKDMSFDDASVRYQKSCCIYENLIAAANESFGVNCWSHIVTSHNIDFTDNCAGKHSVGATACIKVTTKIGIHHEGMGVGICYNVQSQGLAVLIARKESMVNALREALRCFGQPLNTKVEDILPSEYVCKQSLAWSTPNGEWNIDSPTSPLFVRGTTPHKTPSNALSEINTKPVSDEERRQERIRRQRQKQEEFKQKMRQRPSFLNSNSSNGNSNPRGMLENSSNGWTPFENGSAASCNDDDPLMYLQDVDPDIFSSGFSGGQTENKNLLGQIATPQKTMWEFAKENKFINSNTSTVHRKLFLSSNRNGESDIKRRNIAFSETM